MPARGNVIADDSGGVSPGRDSGPDGAGENRCKRSRRAETEGYLSLPFAILTLAIPLFVFGSAPDIYVMSIWITILACGWLFAISGVRHAKGRARGVARLSLAILAWLAAL